MQILSCLTDNCLEQGTSNQETNGLKWGSETFESFVKWLKQVNHLSSKADKWKIFHLYIFYFVYVMSHYQII